MALAEKRQELFTLFRNAAKVAPAEAGGFVAERLERALADASASVQDVEVSPRCKQRSRTLRKLDLPRPNMLSSHIMRVCCMAQCPTAHAPGCS